MRKPVNLEEVLSKLERVKKNGSHWQALCPLHADKNPSLSISVGKDGKILVHCHAGCSQEAVFAALASQVREVAVYDYTDESGTLLFQVVRYEGKEFKQRRPDGNGGWIKNIDGVRRVPYHLPELLEAKDVVILEGEKDVDTARSLGFAATCNPGGADKWKDEYGELLRGKNCVVIPDNDEPGERHADKVARSLHLRAISVKVLRVPEKYKDLSEWNPSREAFAIFLTNAADWSPDKPPDGWRKMFHSFEDFENAPSLSFAIEGFLQNEAITAIAGLSGHGKTFVALSIIKALLFAPSKLWGLFPVPQRAERVVYLIPESSITPFKHRLQLLGVYTEIANDRLLTRTLSKGPTPSLDDKAILYAVRGAHVIIDTGVRFVQDGADESSATDIARGLSDDLLSLLRAGARSVLPLFHSAKAFYKEPTMTLENMIRGSGELGAILATAWGIKQLDRATNTIHIENLKPRDFQPCGAFQIIGRPHIDRDGDFALLKSPDECGVLSDEQPDPRSNKAKQESKAANMALYGAWVEAEPALEYEVARSRFAEKGIRVTASTLRGYARELRKKDEAR